MRPHGVLAPLTTPFERDRVAPARLRENIARYESAGLGGYLLFGSSGEAPLLSEPEKVHLLAAARDAVPGGKPLIVGTGLESTDATISLGRRAADGGADLLLVLTPHYYSSQMTPPALEEHYTRVADASALPLLLYSVPRFTGVEIPVESVIALSRHERIVGIKDSAGDVGRLARQQLETPADFLVICGSHRAALGAAGAGIESAILAAANPFAAAYRETFRLAVAGETVAAQRLHERLAPVSDRVVSRLGVPGIKAAMDLSGLYGGPPRAPLLPVEEETKRELQLQIDALGDSAQASSRD